MKKSVKIILLIAGILVSIILLDTLQARLFKRSPILSVKEKLEDIDSWVDRGILIDTYYCTKEKDIVTVSWKFKNAKFTCPIDNISISELRKFQDDITDIIVTMKNYHNFSAIYVDEEKRIIIVELEDNSQKEQTWFRENIIDLEYIKFIQGGPYYAMDTFDFYIAKEEIHNDIKFYEYYNNSERIIYLARNISEFYILNDNNKETLKDYITHTYSTFDDSIKSITKRLNKESTLRDGGTTIYKSKEKGITMIVCASLAGNKDIYIGDYKLEYEQNMCK